MALTNIDGSFVAFQALFVSRTARRLEFSTANFAKNELSANTGRPVQKWLIVHIEASTANR